MKQIVSQTFDRSQIVSGVGDISIVSSLGMQRKKLVILGITIIISIGLVLVPLAVIRHANRPAGVQPAKTPAGSKNSVNPANPAISSASSNSKPDEGNTATINVPPSTASDSSNSTSSPPQSPPPPGSCPSGQIGTPPNCITPPPQPGWSWPGTLNNTGPAAGTSFTLMAPREFDSADNGKTFNAVQINVGNNQEIYITGSNITFKNCKIIYTGANHLPNGFLFIGKSWLPNIRPKNIVFDHCIIDSGNRHEYGLTVRHGQFSVQYSQIRGASHNIDSGGDLDAGTTTNIYRNYIYDYNDDPYDNPAHTGHANGIYFVGNNGTVNIEENTVIGNRWEQCNAGWSNGPGAGCYEVYGTSAITVYADEDANPDKVYIVKHNKISGGGYYAVRFYAGSASIQSITLSNNVYSSIAGWPQVTDGGGLYVFSGNIGSNSRSGNSWSSDTTCYANPGSCAGTPN